MRICSLRRNARGEEERVPQQCFHAGMVVEVLEIAPRLHLRNEPAVQREAQPARLRLARLARGRQLAVVAAQNELRK